MADPATSGRSSNQRQAQWPLLARLPKHLFGKVGAAAAAARATRGTSQIVQGPDSFHRGSADHVFGNGIADADVHGVHTKDAGCYLIANENDCQQLYGKKHRRLPVEGRDSEI
jgi:hypothetical protein